MNCSGGFFIGYEIEIIFIVVLFCLLDRFLVIGMSRNTIPPLSIICPIKKSIMKKFESYETPKLAVVECALEKGFAASATGIDNPYEATEGNDYWS